MSKKVLGDYDLPNEGDIIDQVAAGQERMQRLKDEVVQLKERTDFVSLLSWLGLEGKENGKGRMYLCPFHDDKNPSLSVDRKKGVWHCFGCGKGGDMVSFIQEYRSTDFKGALLLLREFHGIFPASTIKAFKHKDLPKEKPSITFAEEPGQTPTLDPDQPTVNVDSSRNPDQLPTNQVPSRPSVTLDEACAYYHKTLYKSPPALAYLERRGLNNPELIARFKIGFADGSLSQILSDAQKNAFMNLGIVRDSGVEHFAGCITFPVFDEQDRCVGLYGRMTDPEAKLKHLYLKGAHRGVFNRKASKAYDEIILTEGIIDALSLIRLGFQNVQALYGINGFTVEHLSTLKNDRVKMIVLGFDNDEAGRKGTVTRKAEFLTEGFGVKVICSQGKDWNEDLLAAVENPDTLCASIRSRLATAEAFNPAAPAEGFTVAKHAGRYEFTIGVLSYRLLGVRDGFVSSLKVNILLKHEDKKHIDNLDLYSARSRTSFSQTVGRLTGLSEPRVENDLLRIVDYLEAERDKQLAAYDSKPFVMSEEERAQGMDLLTDPALFDRITSDMETLGYAGEDLNKQLVYLAASSRKLDDPVSVIILSESAAGKSYLIDTVKKLIPPEEVVSMTSLSDQALNYLPEDGLLHKFLVMGEAVHNDVVEHQIREMLSSRELSRLVTLKDEKTGEMSSRIIKKNVIVAAVMSSTNYEINAENLSRCFVVNTDETADQTRKIYQLQRRKYTLARYGERQGVIPRIILAHQSAQRLLRKRVIVNPMASFLRFPDSLMRGRRDHERFIDLIAAICFLRQFQKQEKAAGELSYIECDLSDYRVAYRIMKGVLPVTLTSFPKSALMLYDTVRELLRRKAKAENLKTEEVSLSQREIREQSAYSQMFVKRNLRLLCDYEYLRETGVKDKGSRHLYQLLKDQPLALIDLSMIPTPEELAGELSENSGATGS